MILNIVWSDGRLHHLSEIKSITFQPGQFKVYYQGEKPIQTIWLSEPFGNVDYIQIKE